MCVSILGYQTSHVLLMPDPYPQRMVPRRSAYVLSCRGDSLAVCSIYIRMPTALVPHTNLTLELQHKFLNVCKAMTTLCRDISCKGLCVRRKLFCKDIELVQIPWSLLLQPLFVITTIVPCNETWFFKQPRHVAHLSKARALKRRFFTIFTQLPQEYYASYQSMSDSPKQPLAGI